MEVISIITCALLIIVSISCFKKRGNEDRRWLKLLYSIILSLLIPMILFTTVDYFISNRILEGALFAWSTVGLTVLGFLLFQLFFYDIREID